MKEPIIDDKLTEERAYILGVIGPGDGYIGDARYEIGLSVIDKDFADFFQYCLESTFRLKTSRILEAPHALSKNYFYRVSLYSKKVCEYLRKTYNIDFKEDNWRVPNQIKNSDKDLIGVYLKGFADSQGSVGKRDLSMSSGNFIGLKEIKLLFDTFQIRSTFYQDKDCFKIAIYGRKSLEIFNEKIGFSLKRKADKLNRLLSSYKRNTIPRRVLDEKMPEIIKYLNEGNYKTNAARIFGVHRLTIARRLKVMGVD
jgi:intein-encoded DNA endonuclease-like protein